MSDRLSDVLRFDTANPGYRVWLSVMSRNENAPYETAAEHESPDASRYGRYRDGL
jgi:hypothetical protein